MNDFGNPDLIIVAEDCEQKKHFLFIEAKTSSYQENATQDNQSVSGYNSSINGQLSLKYRFVKALQNSKEEYGVTETPEQFRAYEKVLRDPRGFPRTLKNRVIIESILKPNSFYEATLDNSYFIALTVEEVNYNPFTEESSRDIMPVFLDETGVDVWEDVKGNLGLLNLSKVKKIVTSPEFDEVYEIMTTKREVSEAGKYPNLRSTALSNFPEDVIVCCERFGETLKENSDLDIVRIKGSYSVIDSTGFIVGKIVPRYNEKEVWYGVRESLDIEPFNSEPRGKYCIGPVPFVFYKVKC